MLTRGYRRLRNTKDFNELGRLIYWEYRYSMELRAQTKMVARIAGYLTIGLFSIVLLLFIGGERFAPILEAFGLYHYERGIYADCSKPFNKNNRFCNPDAPRVEQEWKNVRSGTGFSLSGR